MHEPTSATPRETQGAAAKRKDDEQEVRIGMRLMGVGFQVSSEVAAGAGIGWLVDHFFKTGTRGVMIGGIAGVCVAMFTLVRQGLKITKELDAMDRRKRSRGRW